MWPCGRWNAGALERGTLQQARARAVYNPNPLTYYHSTITNPCTYHYNGTTTATVLVQASNDLFERFLFTVFSSFLTRLNLALDKFSYTVDLVTELVEMPDLRSS